MKDGLLNAKPEGGLYFSSYRAQNPVNNLIEFVAFGKKRVGDQTYYVFIYKR